MPVTTSPAAVILGRTSDAAGNPPRGTSDAIDLSRNDIRFKARQAAPDLTLHEALKRSELLQPRRFDLQGLAETNKLSLNLPCAVVPGLLESLNVRKHPLLVFRTLVLYGADSALNRHQLRLRELRLDGHTHTHTLLLLHPRHAAARSEAGKLNTENNTF